MDNVAAPGMHQLCSCTFDRLDPKPQLLFEPPEARADLPSFVWNSLSLIVSDGNTCIPERVHFKLGAAAKQVHVTNAQTCLLKLYKMIPHCPFHVFLVWH